MFWSELFTGRTIDSALIGWSAAMFILVAESIFFSAQSASDWAAMAFLVGALVGVAGGRFGGRVGAAVAGGLVGGATPWIMSTMQCVLSGHWC